MRFAFFAGITALLSASVAYGAPVNNSATVNSPSRYIIKLMDGVHLSMVHDRIMSIHSPVQKPSVHEHIAIGGSFAALTATLHDHHVQTLADFEEIAYVEPDAILSIVDTPAIHHVARSASGTDVQSDPPSWGLARIAHRSLGDVDTENYVYPSSSGEGIEAWVIDTGVDAQHPDFEGRATSVISFVDGAPTADENGHGTHVAGTIAGTTFGVAKKAAIHAVKVLDKEGSGSTSSVLQGIEYVAQHAKKGKSVANMSLGGSTSKALDDAVTAAVDAGVPFFIAAGNDGKNACNTSPARAQGAFAVGASDKHDKLAYFSNVGTCVSIVAPGVDITSAWLNGNENTISGTSMATPHAAGVGALMLANAPLTPDQLYQQMQSLASGSLSGNLKLTPNKLLFNGV